MPAALVITEPFRNLTASFGDTLGAPDYTAVTVPHPVGTLDDDGLAKLADSVVDDVLARLT